MNNVSKITSSILSPTRFVSGYSNCNSATSPKKRSIAQQYPNIKNALSNVTKKAYDTLLPSTTKESIPAAPPILPDITEEDNFVNDSKVEHTNSVPLVDEVRWERQTNQNNRNGDPKSQNTDDSNFQNETIVGKEDKQKTNQSPQKQSKGRSKSKPENQQSQSPVPNESIPITNEETPGRQQIQRRRRREQRLGSISNGVVENTSIDKIMMTPKQRLKRQNQPQQDNDLDGLRRPETSQLSKLLQLQQQQQQQNQEQNNNNTTGDIPMMIVFGNDNESICSELETAKDRHESLLTTPRLAVQNDSNETNNKAYVDSTERRSSLLLSLSTATTTRRTTPNVTKTRRLKKQQQQPPTPATPRTNENDGSDQGPHDQAELTRSKRRDKTKHMTRRNSSHVENNESNHDTKEKTKQMTRRSSSNVSQSSELEDNEKESSNHDIAKEKSKHMTHRSSSNVSQSSELEDNDKESSNHDIAKDKSKHMTRRSSSNVSQSSELEDNDKESSNHDIAKDKSKHMTRRSSSNVSQSSELEDKEKESSNNDIGKFIIVEDSIDRNISNTKKHLEKEGNQEQPRDKIRDGKQRLRKTDSKRLLTKKDKIATKTTDNTVSSHKTKDQPNQNKETKNEIEELTWKRTSSHEKASTKSTINAQQRSSREMSSESIASSNSNMLSQSSSHSKVQQKPSLGTSKRRQLHSKIKRDCMIINPDEVLTWRRMSAPKVNTTTRNRSNSCNDPSISPHSNSTRSMSNDSDDDEDARNGNRYTRSILQKQQMYHRNNEKSMADYEDSECGIETKNSTCTWNSTKTATTATTSATTTTCSTTSVVLGSVSLDDISDQPNNDEGRGLPSISIDSITTETMNQGGKKVRFPKDEAEIVTIHEISKFDKAYHKLLWWSDEDCNNTRRWNEDKLDRNNSKTYSKSADRFVHATMDCKDELLDNEEFDEDTKDTMDVGKSNHSHPRYGVSDRTYKRLEQGISNGYHGINSDNYMDHVPNYIDKVLATYKSSKRLRFTNEHIWKVVGSRSVSLTKRDRVYAALIGQICSDLEQRYDNNDDNDRTTEQQQGL